MQMTNLYVGTNIPMSGKNLLCFLTIEGATKENDTFLTVKK